WQRVLSGVRQGRAPSVAAVASARENFEGPQLAGAGRRRGSVDVRIDRGLERTAGPGTRPDLAKIADHRDDRSAGAFRSPAQAPPHDVVGSEQLRRRKLIHGNIVAAEAK